MRILFFIEPFPVRGRPLDYQWVLDRWLAIAGPLAARGAEITFALSDEMAAANAGCHQRVFRPSDFGVSAGGTDAHLDAEWVALMTEARHPHWSTFASQLLERARPDVVVSWTVNKPLLTECTARRTPILHVEAGPVRTRDGMLYYADPVGVNGDSAMPHLWASIRGKALTDGEESRLDAFIGEFVRDSELAKTRAHFQSRCGLVAGKKVIGVFQQVSRDSNVLAWSHVQGNRGLLEAVAARFPSERYQILLKAHPNEPAVPTLPGVDLHIAPSCVAQQVIDASDAVCLSNSSVGVEVLAAGKPLYVFGRSPYSMPECTRDGMSAMTSDVSPFSANERLYSRRLLSFIFMRYLASERELSDADAFSARLGRLVNWYRAGASLEEWFLPDIDATRLRDMRAGAELSQLKRRADAEGAELSQLRHDDAELRTSNSNLTAAIDAARKRLAEVEPAWAAAQGEIRRLSHENVELGRSLAETLDRADKAESALHVTQQHLRAIEGSLVQRIAQTAKAAPGLRKALHLLRLIRGLHR